jgi:hypothetical protein
LLPLTAIVLPVVLLADLFSVLLLEQDDYPTGGFCHHARPQPLPFPLLKSPPDAVKGLASPRFVPGEPLLVPVTSAAARATLRSPPRPPRRTPPAELGAGDGG